MADAPASTPSTGSKGSGLTRKVGPLPVWGWALIGFGAYYWWTHFGPGSSGTGVTGAGASAQTPGVTIGNITQTLRGGTGAAGTSSGGGATVTVPNVVGDNDKVGDAKIIAAGLKVHDVNEPKGGVGGKGTNPPLISAQSPAANTKVAPGSTVSVTFASKPAAGKPAKGKPPRKTTGTATNSTTPPTGTTGVPAGTGSNVINVSTPGQGFQYLPTGGPVNADTGGPVYEEWVHAHRGPQVPEPVLAYAPATSGATYGPAVDVGPPPEVTQTVSQSTSQSANPGATTGGA